MALSKEKSGYCIAGDSDRRLWGAGPSRPSCGRHGQDKQDAATFDRESLGVTSWTFFSGPRRPFFALRKAR